MYINYICIIISGQYEKTPLSHTQSVPSIPVSVSTNGLHDNRDYDSIYDSVLNFDTNLKNSSSEMRVVENKENNNSFKAPKAKSDGISTDSVLSEVSKTNSCYGDNKHVNGDEKIENNVPVAPMRPVRKKKSMRQNRDDLSRQSSGSSQGNTENTMTKMPMEYLSDSPEMSPRDNLNCAGSTCSSEKSPKLNTKNAENDSVVKHESVVKSEPVSVNEIPAESVMVKTVTEVSEHSVPSTEEFSREITSLKIGIQDQNENSGNVNKITEIGEDKKISEMDLEVERVDFESQKRNFGKANFESLCNKETENQTKIEHFLEEKLKSKPAVRSVVEKTVGAQKLSTSLESLDDIDKLLKEQVNIYIVHVLFFLYISTY